MTSACGLRKPPTSDEQAGVVAQPAYAVARSSNTSAERGIHAALRAFRLQDLRSGPRFWLDAPAAASCLPFYCVRFSALRAEKRTPLEVKYRGPELDERRPKAKRRPAYVLLV